MILVEETRDEEYIIIQRRGRGVSYYGHLEIPRGFVKYGEDLKEAALREVKEKTGIEEGEISVSSIFIPWEYWVGIHQIGFTGIGKVERTDFPVARNSKEMRRFEEKNEEVAMVFPTRCG